MKDYSAMSDLEINKAVAAFNPETYYVSDEGEPVHLEPDPAPAYTGSDYNEVVFDPCNNPADAWPIIVGSRIALMPDASHHEAHQWWDAQSSCQIYGIQYQDNPLRAAMIVYLMMQE